MHKHRWLGSVALFQSLRLALLVPARYSPAAFVINIDQTREILDTFGLFGGKKKKSSKSWVGESILGSGRSRFS